MDAVQPNRARYLARVSALAAIRRIPRTCMTPRQIVAMTTATVTTKCQPDEGSPMPSPGHERPTPAQTMATGIDKAHWRAIVRW